MGTKAAPDDWRRQGQDKYLKGKTLIFQSYRIYRDGWDHDHCEFCSAKFSMLPDDLTEGYSTDDCYHWVCKACFEDFKGEFEWTTTKT